MRESIQMSDRQDSKLWGGRFTENTDAFVEKFTSSIAFDKRLYKQDIAGSKAHARMLEHVGLLTRDESDLIINGLEAIEADIDNNHFQWDLSLEDVHMNIEARLTERIGPIGKKLHTGRSRNDQVATDLRLWLRDQIDEIIGVLKILRNNIIDLAEKESDTIMPGFTHLQIAMPITFGHHLMAWQQMLFRDTERFRETRHRVNSMPLGSAALAGTTFPIDREFTANLLGFETIAPNSIDAVSDRDFAIEFTAASAITMMHLSRISEELILWSSAQFNFISLPDRFCTGSSIMPQKKNPDVPELVRGKSGRVYGSLNALLTLMKSQPLAYNKDNQEDKEPLFDCVDTVFFCLKAFADMIPAIEPHREQMLQSAKLGYATATDLADYLVRKGLPFRDAHEIVGKAVRFCIDSQQDLSDIPLYELQKFSELINEDVYEILTLQGSVASRNHFGGTAPEAVLKQIHLARDTLDNE